MERVDDRRNARRDTVQTEIMVNIDTENMEATCVNLSETGICFNTTTPLEIDIRFMLDEKHSSQTGRLVWAKKNQGGGFTYGFEFIDK